MRRHSVRRKGGSQRRFTIMFLLVLLPPAATLVWLGLRMLEQDRIIQTRNEKEGREAAAEEIVRSLAESIRDFETAPEDSQWPEGLLRVTIAGATTRAQPAERMLWMEKPALLPETATEPFKNARKAEYQGNLESALAVYREWTHSADSRVRAGALLGVARVERNRGQSGAALDAYRNLAAIPGIAYDGTPVDFLARREICRLLHSAGRSEEFREQLNPFVADFLSNRWTLDRPRWAVAANDIEQWTGRPLLNSGDRKALSDAVEWIWQNSRSGNLRVSGRRNVDLESGLATISWRTAGLPDQPLQLTAFVMTATAVQAFTEKAVKDVSDKMGRISLLTDSGELLFGKAADSANSSSDILRRSLADTGLPWTLVLQADDRSRAAADVEGRRRLLGWGLAAVVLLLSGGGYVLWRAIRREMAVARLQTDFVATVSHEFRTPLTSLRHITELLQENNGFPHDPRQERLVTFYAALGRNTERLRRLVESLLDFSRMETGKKPWRMEPLDAGILTADIASEFQKEVEEHGVRIDCAVDDDSLPLHADADALGHALWNLLDNAVKYSPQGSAVRVSAARSSQAIVISVMDQGPGIPVQERGQIFEKFVRGDRARELGIKGTGLGLAIVSHIVEAHGGAVELESEEGKGSTFSLVFPLEA